MANFKFNKVSFRLEMKDARIAQLLQNRYGATKGAVKPPAQPRQSRSSFQKTILTSPTSPESLSLRCQTPLSSSLTPTLSPSSSSSSNQSFSTSSSEAPPLFTTEFFEVRKSPKGGYGAFAIKDIEKDIVIMAEKPLFRATYMEVYYKYESLSTSQREEYRSLHGWEGVNEHQVLSIFKTNRYVHTRSTSYRAENFLESTTPLLIVSIDSFETSEGKGGIFLKSSRFNHACHPFSTCTYSYNQSQGRLITKTLQAIPRGQEITISYCNVPTFLYENYGFYCDCPNCESPAKAKARAAMLRGRE